MPELQIEKVEHAEGEWTMKVPYITTRFSLLQDDGSELIITPDVADGAGMLVVRVGEPDDPFDWRVASDGQEFMLA